MNAALFHHLIDRGNDLAHGVLRHVVLHPLILSVGDKGKPQGRLPGVVGHGVGDQRDPQLLRHLLHDGGLSDSRRAQQKDRTLSDKGNPISALLVLFQINLHRILDIFFCLADIHIPFYSSPSNSSSFSTILIAQGGTFGALSSSFKNMNAAS